MENIRRSVRELEKILELTKLINSTNDIQTILNSIMDVTLSLMPRADIGVIFLYNEKTGLLDLTTSIGFGSIDMSLRPGESITGIAFEKKKTLHLTSKEEMMAAMGTMDTDKYGRLETTIPRGMETIQSSISVPLMFQEEAIGVFVIDNYQGKAPLNRDDIYLAEWISQHATTAIVNAKNYEKILENQRNLTIYSEMVEEEKNRYEYSTFLHGKFTEMVLNGSTIQDVVKEVSEILSAGIFIMDPLFNISHFSLRVFTIEELNSEKAYFTPRLERSTEVIYYCTKPSLWIYLNPIRVNKEVLGWVGVISNSPRYNELEKVTINNCSTIVALEMLKSNEIAIMEQSLKGDFLDNLLLEKSEDFLKKFATKFNYDFRKNHQMTVIRYSEDTFDSPRGKDFKLLYQEINQLMMEKLAGSFTIPKNNFLITIFESRETYDRDYLTDLIYRIFEKSRYTLSHLKIDYSCQVMVSEVIQRQEDFKSVYENTLQVFSMDLWQDKKQSYNFYEDLEIKKFLMKNKLEDLESFVLKTLGPLFEYPNASRKDLFETLKTYLKTGKDFALTKTQLHIHPNTLTYRINRLKDILDIDFKEYHDVLKLQIALEILEITSDFKGFDLNKIE